MSCIFVQKLTAMDQYSLSYGPAKFDVAMVSFDVETRWAITQWISVRGHRFLQENVVNDVGYHSENRGTTAKRRDQTRRDIATWRQISWFVDGIWRFSCTCTVTFFYMLLYMVDFFEWGKHARGLNCFVLCATVDAMIVAFDTSDGWIILSLHTRELVLKIIILEKSRVKSSHTGRPPRKTIR